MSEFLKSVSPDAWVIFLGLIVSGPTLGAVEKQLTRIAAALEKIVAALPRNRA
jgi:hypothetical protein